MYSGSPINLMQEKYKENPRSVIRLLKTETMGKSSKQTEKKDKLPSKEHQLDQKVLSIEITDMEYTGWNDNWR